MNKQKHNFSIFRPDQEVFNQETKFKIEIKKDDTFLKVLGTCDFTKCKDDMEAVRTFWDAVWPALATVVSDNEILLEEQRLTLRNYGTLMEDHKWREVRNRLQGSLHFFLEY